MPKRDRFEHGVPSWVELSGTDVEAAQRFYSGLFDWEWTSSDIPGAGAYWIARLQGEAIAGLSPGQGSNGLATWTTYVNVSSVDDAVSRAEAAGATVLAPPMDVGDTGRMAIVSDPVGAAIGMWQAGSFHGAGVVNEPGAMTWNEVYAPDTDAVVAFYGQAFGWTVSTTPMPDGSAYTTFNAGGAPVGGTALPRPGDAPPHWQVWFGTADTDATAARAAQLGGTVVVAPTDSSLGRFAFFRDPAGAAFSVITPASRPA